MKKISLFLILVISLFGIRDVHATSWWDSSFSPSSAYLSDNSTIYNIMNDSNTTCKNYLESIKYDLYSQIGQEHSSYLIDFHYESNYNSSENTFKFKLYYGAKGFYLQYNTNKGLITDVYLRISFPGKVTYTDYIVDCSSGTIKSLGSNTINDSYTDVSILEKRDLGYEFFPSMYQSSFGSIYYENLYNNIVTGYNFYLSGVYNSENQEVMNIDEFIGSDYYSNNFLLGSGVGLMPFYSVLSNDFGNIDIPYNGNYNYIFGNANSVLYFTPKVELADDIDAKIYMKPVILEENLLDKIDDILKDVDFKLGVYPNYQDLSTHTDYSFYWNDDYNGFLVIDSKYLTNSATMYQIHFSNANSGGYSKINQAIFYYNPDFWNVTFYPLNANVSDVTISGVNGNVNYNSNTLDNNYISVDKNNNIQNKPMYSDGSTSSGFLSGLLGNIAGITEFISSIGSGITTLTDSISSLVTMAFGTLNALPVAISSLLYLCFLLTIVAIILKIFL